MTEAMPFLRKLILLSYDPRPSGRGLVLFCRNLPRRREKGPEGFDILPLSP